MEQVYSMEDFKDLIKYRSKRVAARTIPGERGFMNSSTLKITYKLVGRAGGQIEVACHTLELPVLELL